MWSASSLDEVAHSWWKVAAANGFSDPETAGVVDSAVCNGAGATCIGSSGPHECLYLVNLSARKPIQKLR